MATYVRLLLSKPLRWRTCWPCHTLGLWPKLMQELLACGRKRNATRFTDTANTGLWLQDVWPSSLRLNPQTLPFWTLERPLVRCCVVCMIYDDGVLFQCIMQSEITRKVTAVNGPTLALLPRNTLCTAGQRLSLIHISEPTRPY